jgi:hypothetical protein
MSKSNMSADNKSKLMLSIQTQEGLKITGMTQARCNLFHIVLYYSVLFY